MTLRAENLTKRFNGIRALDGATVEFAEGRISAIIGPNGAGKTTLVNALTGFQRVDAGRTFLGTVETTRFSPERVARLGVARTFQEVRLVWRETVLDNVMVAVRCSNEGFLHALTKIGWAEESEEIQSKALEALRIVGMNEQAGAFAADLSYGQQKLLALARCLAADARWLILDEPVSGVSPPLVEHLLETLRLLSKEGRAIILIEHNIRAVSEVADVVVVLDEGRVVATGATNEVFAQREVLEAYLG